MIEDRQKLFALEGAARLDERMHCKVQADYGEDCFNRGALMVGKVIFVVLTYQGRGAENRKEDEHQAGGLQPKRVKGAAYRRNKGFAAGKDRVEQAVFLYNALYSIFNRGNLGHLGHCSAKIGPNERKNKTLVPPRASN